MCSYHFSSWHLVCTSQYTKRTHKPRTVPTISSSYRSYYTLHSFQLVSLRRHGPLIRKSIQFTSLERVWPLAQLPIGSATSSSPPSSSQPWRQTQERCTLSLYSLASPSLPGSLCIAWCPRQLIKKSRIIFVRLSETKNIMLRQMLIELQI